MIRLITPRCVNNIPGGGLHCFSAAWWQLQARRNRNQRPDSSGFNPASRRVATEVPRPNTDKALSGRIRIFTHVPLRFSPRRAQNALVNRSRSKMFERTRAARSVTRHFKRCHRQDWVRRHIPMKVFRARVATARRSHGCVLIPGAITRTRIVWQQE